MPVTWDREPACSATAVRDPLVLTGKPWKKSRRDVGGADADHLLVASDPLALASGEGRCRRHGVRERDDRDGERSGEQRRHVTPADSREREGRKALWEHADRVDALGLEVEQVDRHGGQHHDDEDTRDLGQQPVQEQDADQGTHAEEGGRRVGLAVREPHHEGAHLVHQPVSIDGEPEELGQLTDDDGQRQPVHVADLGRLRQQVRDEPELGQPGDHHHHADQHRQQRGERNGSRGVAAREHEGGDRRRDHRAKGRVWAQHQHPGRPEDRVAEQAQDRGVEPGHGRQPGQLRVGHPLGHQQRRQDEAGDDVPGQPRPLVGAGQPQAGHVLLPPRRCHVGAVGESGHRRQPSFRAAVQKRRTSPEGVPSPSGQVTTAQATVRRARRSSPRMVDIRTAPRPDRSTAPLSSAALIGGECLAGDRRPWSRVSTVAVFGNWMPKERQP
jgi:hypothetical protein